ncbi:ATPase, T2SS/T4P/T4SS family [Luedemannella flava]
MLMALVEAEGSDLHLTVNAPPSMRVNGELCHLPGHGPLNALDIAALLRTAVDAERWEQFRGDHELNFAYEVNGLFRFRGNFYQQRGAFGAVFRAIPHRIKSLEELGLPPAVARFAELSRGLVLVTGPTGSGKSSTLAALVDLVNRTRSTTSSRSRTRSSTCTRTTGAWSTSARSGRTPAPSRRRSRTRCGRTPT